VNGGGSEMPEKTQKAKGPLWKETKEALRRVGPSQPAATHKTLEVVL